MAQDARLARPLTLEEQTSLRHLRRFLSESDLSETGAVDFLEYFSTRPSRTFRLEAVSYTVLMLGRRGVSAQRIKSLLGALRLLLECEVYDLHIEEYLEGARHFPRVFLKVFGEDFWAVYTSEDVCRDQELFTCLHTVVRHYGRIIQDGDLRAPSEDSLVTKVFGKVFTLIKSAESGEQRAAACALLDFMNGLCYLAISRGKDLRRRHLVSLRNFGAELLALDSLEGLCPHRAEVVAMTEELWVFVRGKEKSEIGELWKGLSIKF